MGLFYRLFLSLGFGLCLMAPVFAATPPTPTPAPAVNPAPSGTPNQSTQPAVTGGENGTSQASAEPSQQSEDIWQRSTLLGDLGGFRNDVVNQGFTFTPVYTGEIMGNVSGGAGGYDGRGHGVIYEHSLNLPVDVDLSKIVSEWHDSVIHANAFWIAGPGLSPSYVGDLSNTSYIQGYNTLRLQELWYQQAFWSKRISVKVGEIAADSEFFSSSTSSLFFSGTFGAFNILSANLTDPYDPNVYPMASPGIRFLIQPVPVFYFMSGLFNGSSGSQTGNNHGVDFPIDSQSGALLFNEVGYLINQSPQDKGLQGTYKFGSFVQTHDFNDWSSQQANAVSGAPLHDTGADYGIYGVGDQQIYQEGDRLASVFARIGNAPSDANVVDWYVDGGFNFTGFVPGRKDDVAGVAFARSCISSAYSDYEVGAHGTNPYTAETLVEATYKVQIAPWWSLQPDLQYIITPSGQTGSPNAVVIGLRTQVAF